MGKKKGACKTEWCAKSVRKAANRKPHGGPGLAPRGVTPLKEAQEIRKVLKKT